MHRVCLFLARTAVSAWIGAAVLFVVVGVSEILHTGFDSVIRDQLVLIRFPWYYRFGAVLLAVGLIGTLGAPHDDGFSVRKQRIAAALIAAALAVMFAEYFTVYLHLVELVTPPGKARTADFPLYHRASMWINLGELLCCLAAMGLLNWPAKRP